MWVELITQDKIRILVNLDTTFCFQEMPGGMTGAVSITGVSVPVALPYEKVRTDILTELG